GNFPAPFLTESVIAEARFSDTDFTKPLLTIPAIAEARLSDVLRNPWNNLVTLSDIADTEFSEMPRAPVKTLPMTSEGTRLTCANFPAPLLSETAIETTSDRDFTTPLFTTSEIADERSSDVVLNPVKTLDAAADMVGVSVSVLNPVKTLLTTSETETTSDRDFTTPLFTTSEIADERSSDVVLNPVKTLATAADIASVSGSDLTPWTAL